MRIDAIAALTLASLAAVALLSYAVEALRPRPHRPGNLSWDPGLSVEYVDLDGVKVRYVKTGSGPAILLLHTLRTQLDIFQKMIPALAQHFTVYAYDYPGHGWSDIPPADYTPEDFYKWTAAFLDALNIDQACLAGISIGGTIALVLAARQNPRVVCATSINPYDYMPAGGIRGSSPMARLILGPADVPMLGATLMRLRNRFVTDAIMRGGVAAADALSPVLKKELYDVGARPGHYQGFLGLLSHERRWAEARKEYPRVRIPTLLVYGDEDWAPIAERERERALIPDVTLKTIAHGGHFLSLDRPRELTDLIVEFAAGARSQSGARPSG